MVIFSGGTTGGKRKGLTLMQGKTIKGMSSDTVIDFICLTTTPWKTGMTQLDMSCFHHDKIHIFSLWIITKLQSLYLQIVRTHMLLWQ